MAQAAVTRIPLSHSGYGRAQFMDSCGMCEKAGHAEEGFLVTTTGSDHGCVSLGG